MSQEIIRIKSINELHEFMGFAKPTHPLISIIDVSKLEIRKEWLHLKMTSDLYLISLKDKSCGLDYGRNQYDFNEGMLMFTGPDQLYSVTKEQKLNEVQGWMLYFHPDLLRNTPLETTIDSHSFFSYAVHEALHLSDQEEKTITDCVAMIQQEIAERIDNHSQRVIVSGLELLLNFCSRYYERQFTTRSSQNKDVLTQMEYLLKNYYQSGQLVENGPPTVQYFAEKIQLSPNYLSDLLKKETGRSAKHHVNEFLVGKAKNMLLISTGSVSEIAYSLGFNYPHYFSRLFKSKTGMTPQEYRRLN